VSGYENRWQRLTFDGLPVVDDRERFNAGHIEFDEEASAFRIRVLPALAGFL
jgi:hypothetical protein